MRAEPTLNGSDYLMLGFDHELRKQGFAGNNCHVVLDFASTLSADVLRRRLDLFAERYPILGARCGGLISPRWKMPGSRADTPSVTVFHDGPELLAGRINTPLDTRHGELLRFDLFEGDAGRARLLFTWHKPLMDAPSAEYLLAVVGREELPFPNADWTPPARPKLPLKERGKVAWKSIHQLDEMCKAAPRSLGRRRPRATPLQKAHVEKFSLEETARVRAAGVRHAGVLGDAQFHVAVATIELHRLHQRLGAPAPSYVVPMPVGLRGKGSCEPLFANQIGMMMIQFLPEHLDSVATAAATIKAQMGQVMRSGLVESGVLLSEMFRFLPLPVYMAMIKHGLRGEICSLFYGDTAAVNPLLTTFLGVPIEDFTHIAAITPSPGVGVVFFYFRGALRVTVMHLTTVLNEEEAAGFAAGLRARLLES